MEQRKHNSLAWLKRASGLCCLIALGFGAGLVSAEIAVRVLSPVSDFFWQWDPVIGMKLIPGRQGRSVKPGLFDVPVRVNSAGFRDREHAIEKPADVRRVVILGDSLVEAMQVPFEQSVTSVLERQLQDDGIRSEAINLGVSGTGTAREYLTLREYGLKYKPDMVLVFFVLNDFGDNTRQLKGLSYIPYPEVTHDGQLVRDSSGHPTFTSFADQPSRLSFVTDVLRDYSKSYRLLRETMDGMPSLNEIKARFGLTSAVASNSSKVEDFGLYEVYRSEPKPVWATAWHVTEDLLVAMRDLAAENHAEFGVVLVPGAWEVYPQAWEDVLAATPALRQAAGDLKLPSSRLSQFLHKHDVHVINLLPELRGRVGSSVPLYLRGDGHWTSAGHYFAAKIIAQDIAKNLSAKIGDLTNTNLLP